MQSFQKHFIVSLILYMHAILFFLSWLSALLARLVNALSNNEWAPLSTVFPALFLEPQRPCKTKQNKFWKSDQNKSDEKLTYLLL